MKGVAAFFLSPFFLTTIQPPSLKTWTPLTPSPPLPSTHTHTHTSPCLSAHMRNQPSHKGEPLSNNSNIKSSRMALRLLAFRSGSLGKWIPALRLWNLNLKVAVTGFKSCRAGHDNYTDCETLGSAQKKGVSRYPQQVLTENQFGLGTESRSRKQTRLDNNLTHYVSRAL